MTEKNACCGGPVKMVLACAGACNVGQISNEVGKRLDTSGWAKYFCLAGVGGHISGMVASVKGADRVLVIDGCPVGCGKQAMQQASLPDFEHLIVSELGIEKRHVFDLREEDIAKTETAARKELAGK